MLVVIRIRAAMASGEKNIQCKNMVQDETELPFKPGFLTVILLLKFMIEKIQFNLLFEKKSVNGLLNKL